MDRLEGVARRRWVEEGCEAGDSRKANGEYQHQRQSNYCCHARGEECLGDGWAAGLRRSGSLWGQKDNRAYWCCSTLRGHLVPFQFAAVMGYLVRVNMLKGDSDGKYMTVVRLPLYEVVV